MKKVYTHDQLRKYKYIPRMAMDFILLDPGSTMKGCIFHAQIYRGRKFLTTIAFFVLYESLKYVRRAHKDAFIGRKERFMISGLSTGMFSEYGLHVVGFDYITSLRSYMKKNFNRLVFSSSS